MHDASKDVIDSIIDWMEKFVEVPHPSFGNMPPCPYARQFRLQNKVKIVEAKKDIWEECKHQMQDWDDSWEAIILATKDTDINSNTLSQKISECNDTFKKDDLVALEDHPHSEEIIDGVKMNHGSLVLVVVQRLKRLNQFSKNLQQTKYYHNWSEENLDDVVNWRFED
jgi:hypothetical protein